MLGFPGAKVVVRKSSRGRAQSSGQGDLTRKRSERILYVIVIDQPQKLCHDCREAPVRGMVGEERAHARYCSNNNAAVPRLVRLGLVAKSSSTPPRRHWIASWCHHWDFSVRLFGLVAGTLQPR